MRARTAIAAILLGLIGTAASQAREPDLIVGDLVGWFRYTPPYNGFHAFAVGTTSCNIGNTVLQWQGNTNQHPVIATNMYRYKLVDGAGHFEQIATGWVKHGFAALNEKVCGACLTHDGNFSTLDPTCSDPYDASTNGTQSRLGPRYPVNSNTGAFPFPVTGIPSLPPIGDPQRVVFRRMQAFYTDLAPNLNPDSIYFVESQYVTPDDSAWGNDLNNVSYRRFLVLLASDGGYNPIFSGYQTARERSALYGWQSVDPGVQIVNCDVPGEGRFEVGYKVTDLGDGRWNFEYAIRNHNSDRAARALSLDLPGRNVGAMVVLSDSFRGPRYHSGEPYANIPWAFAKGSASVGWSTQTYAENPNADALRWGTVCTFRVVTPYPPVAGTATLELFTPGATTSVSVNVLVPAAPMCDVDFNNDDIFPDSADLYDMLDVFAGGACSTANCDSIDVNGDGVFPDIADLEAFLAAFGGAC